MLILDVRTGSVKNSLGSRGFFSKVTEDPITAKDTENELKRIEYWLKPMDIVLLHDGADEFWGNPEYLFKDAGITRESTLYLLKQGLKAVGIDAWSRDRPEPYPNHCSLHLIMK